MKTLIICIKKQKDINYCFFIFSLGALQATDDFQLKFKSNGVIKFIFFRVMTQLGLTCYINYSFNINIFTHLSIFIKFVTLTKACLHKTKL